MEYPIPDTVAPSEVLGIAQRLEQAYPGAPIAREAVAVLRRLHERLAPASLSIDVAHSTVSRRGITMRFSPNQTAIIYRLAQAHPRHVPMTEIKVSVWGAAAASRRPNTNVLQVAISDAREKLMALGVSIENKRNVGYRLHINGVN